MKLVKAINPNAPREEEPVSVLTSTFIENSDNATLTSKEVAKNNEKHQHFRGLARAGAVAGGRWPVAK